MSLRDDFADVMMTLACRTCGFAITKKGAGLSQLVATNARAVECKGVSLTTIRSGFLTRAAVEGQRIRQKG
jgi:hypothetical protein